MLELEATVALYAGMMGYEVLKKWLNSISWRWE